jgi:dipeptidyl aminopeptidase/acylaminoacyl peptidase
MAYITGIRRIPTFAPWYDYAKYPAIAKKAFESSPEYFVKGWKNPVLMIHGDDDRNVPVSESVNMAEILRRQGVHVEQLVFPDEVHGFLLYKNWVKAYTATFEIHRKAVHQKITLWKSTTTRIQAIKNSKNIFWSS